MEHLSNYQLFRETDAFLTAAQSKQNFYLFYENKFYQSTCVSLNHPVGSCCYPLLYLFNIREGNSILTAGYYCFSFVKFISNYSKETLREALSKLVSTKKLKVKLHNGKNSYYIENDSFHEDKSKCQEIEDAKNVFTSDHETALPQDDIETPKRGTLVINDIGNNDEIYDLHKYVQSLATEMEAMKLFIKEQFCLLKKSISEINSNTDATDNSSTETTHVLRKHIEFLLQENASKNTIIKILAKNQQHASNTKEVVSSEPFKTVKGNFIKNRYKPKSQDVVCSNRYDTLYPADDS